MAARRLAAAAALAAVASARAQEGESCQMITVPGQAEREFCVSANGAELQLTVSPVGDGFFAAGIMFPGNSEDDDEGYFGVGNKNSGNIGAVAGISKTNTCYRGGQGEISPCAFTRILPFSGGLNFPVGRCTEASTECKLGQEVLSPTPEPEFSLSGDVATLTVTIDEQYAGLTSIDIITASLTQPNNKDNTLANEAGTITTFNLGGDVEPTEGPSATPVSASPSASPTLSPTLGEGEGTASPSTSPTSMPSIAPTVGGTDDNNTTTTEAPTASPVVDTTESPTTSPTATQAPTIPLNQEFSEEIFQDGKVFYTAREGGAVDFVVQLSRGVLQENGFIGVGVSPDGNMVGGFAVIASLVDGAAQELKTVKLGGKDPSLVTDYVETERRMQASGCDTEDVLLVSEDNLEITFCRNKIGDLDVIDSNGKLLPFIFAFGDSPTLEFGHNSQSRQSLQATFDDESTQAPTTSDDDDEGDDGDDDDDSNGGMIAGIVIAVLAVIAIVVATVLCLRKKKNDRAPRQLPTKNEHAHPAGTAQHTQEPKVVVDKPTGQGAASPPTTAAPQQVTRN